MKNIGVVINLIDDDATLRFIKESACGGNCSGCGGCASKPIEVKLKNTLNVKEGDKVEVESDTHKILFWAFMLYIMPIIALLTAYGICSLFLKENTALVTGVVAFFAAFYIIKMYSKKFRNELKMIRITEEK